jgi:hypothetical protein
MTVAFVVEIHQSWNERKSLGQIRFPSYPIVQNAIEFSIQIPSEGKSNLIHNHERTTVLSLIKLVLNKSYRKVQLF